MVQEIVKIAKKWWKKVLSPPDHIVDESTSIKSHLASSWRQIILVDVIIWVFLIASIQQLAFVFGRGELSFVAYAKAIGIDGSIWLLSRTIAMNYAHQAVVKAGRGIKAVQSNNSMVRIVLWSGLLAFMAATTVVNVYYELWERSATPGEIVLQDAVDYSILAVQMLSSAFLAIIILFMTFVRALLQRDMKESFRDFKRAEIEAEELEKKRKAQREYMRKIRSGEHKPRPKKAVKKAIKKSVKKSRRAA